MMGRRRGFTLIELLVVIAIILILAALILPAIWQTQRAAELAKCTTNLKSIFNAFTNYAQAYSNFYPPMDVPYLAFTDADNVDRAAGDGWFGFLCGSVFSGQYKNFQCPTKPRGLSTTDISYGYNVEVGGWPTVAVATSPPAVGGDFQRRGHTILVADSAQGDYEYAIKPHDTSIVMGSPTNCVECDPRHQDKANCLMADSHCEQLSVNELDTTGSNNWWTLKKR